MTLRCIMVFLYKWQNGYPQYLLLKRSQDLGGYWQPVTGFINEPETNRYAALRELNEETGIEIYERITDLNLYFFIDINGTICSVSVLAVEVSNAPDIEISFEHTECKWLLYEEARETLFWQNNIETLDKLHHHLLAQSKHDNRR